MPVHVYIPQPHVGLNQFPRALFVLPGYFFLVIVFDLFHLVFSNEGRLLFVGYH